VVYPLIRVPAGCNLTCKFCQNWDISKSREMEALAAAAMPEAISEAAAAYGCKSVAFTYNDPVIFAEYAMDVPTPATNGASRRWR
jgi:pyruvate formate lyase activating enzyme